MFDNFIEKDDMTQKIQKSQKVEEESIVHDVTQFQSASLDVTELREKNLPHSFVNKYHLKSIA